MTMGYGDILLIAVIGFTVRHVLIADASRRSKYLVGGFCVALLVGGWVLPVPAILSTLLMLGLCTYIILYETVSSFERDRSEAPQPTHTEHRSSNTTPTDRQG